jgi:hypothetical protein
MGKNMIGCIYKEERMKASQNGNNVVKILSDVTECLKCPTLTKSEQISTIVGFWALTGLFYPIVLLIDKQERECIGKVARFHKEMANRYKTAVMTNQHYWEERRQYVRAI